MRLLSGFSREDHFDLQGRIESEVGACLSLEAAAQSYMSILYETFGASIVLARLFATIALRELPEPNRAFVGDLAGNAGIADRIHDDTLILSLLGTRGERPDWDDRRQSKGHVGIPLASSTFVDQIPMVSRLLKQLGAGLDWIDSGDSQIVSRTFGNLSGVFYVEDAAGEVDAQGRKIIAAQDFVRAFGVRTVFGIGGCYLGTSVFFVIVLFLREYVEKDVAERFMLQANRFKAVTLPVVDGRQFFV
jgi:hypothetical protein